MENQTSEIRNDLLSDSGVQHIEQPPVQVDLSEQRPDLASVAQIKHVFSDGVYIKAYAVPAGAKLVNKMFPTAHVTILGKGAVLIKSDDGRQAFRAPAHFNFEANTRYKITILEDSVWYCIHPTDETDTSVIIEKY